MTPAAVHLSVLHVMTGPESSMNQSHLRGWKEISTYLGISVRTAQRWETEFGLPIVRVPTDKHAGVAARRVELDAWFHENLDRLREDSQARTASDEAEESENAGGAGADEEPVGTIRDANSVRPSWRDSRLTSGRILMLVALGVVLVAGAWFGASRFMRGGEQPVTPVPELSLPEGSSAANSHGPAPATRRAVLVLTAGDGTSMTARIREGEMGTVNVPGAGNFGLTPLFSQSGLVVTPSKLEVMNKSGAVRVLVGSGRTLKQRAPESLAAQGIPIVVEWVGEDLASEPSPIPSAPNERCCVTCGILTGCGEEVASSCGSCRLPHHALPR